MSAWTRTLPLLFAVATTACPGSTGPTPPPSPAPEAPPPSIDVPAARPDPTAGVPTRSVAVDEKSADVIASKRAEILDDPALRDLTFQAAFVEPFVVFQEVNEQDVRDTIRKYDDRDGAMKVAPVDGTANPAKVEQNIRWAEKADGLAKRRAVLLADLDRRFRELFAERFNLPTLAERGRHPTVVSLWNERHYMRAFRAPPRPEQAREFRGHHDPVTHSFVSYLGDEFLMSEDELLCDDDHVQKLGDQSLLAAGARQLLREYAAIHRGRPLEDGAPEESPPVPMWFESGFADWLGAIEVPLDKLEAPAGEDVRHERIYLDCIRESRESRDVAEMWKLKDLMKPLHLG